MGHGAGWSPQQRFSVGCVQGELSTHLVCSTSCSSRHLDKAMGILQWLHHYHLVCCASQVSFFYVDVFWASKITVEHTFDACPKSFRIIAYLYVSDSSCR